MRSLFRALESEGVRYLLISGQACVLYGASAFTEDVDLWIEPKRSNLRSFLRALARVRARVYKMTPPFSLRNVRAGHGFHFHVGADLYVDAMGRPPRVGTFAEARDRARRMATDWGTLPVAAPEDLVLLKRTNRPGDYEAISNLVRMRVDESTEPAVLLWALRNTFDVQDLAEYARKASVALARRSGRPAVRALVPSGRETAAISETRIRIAARLLATEMGELQERGRRYWLPIIAELKRLRLRGKLIAEGTPVSRLLESIRR